MEQEKIEESTINKEENLFNDYIRRGDDFFRIELFKSSREMYEEAKKIKPTDEYAASRIDECRRLIKLDTRRILFVLPFLILIVGGIIYYKSNTCTCKFSMPHSSPTAMAKN